MAATESEGAGLLQELTSKLQGLPEKRLQEVLNFVDFLRNRSVQQAKRGSAEEVLQHAGTWSFEPGELDRLLVDIQEMREIELDR